MARSDQKMKLIHTANHTSDKLFYRTNDKVLSQVLITRQKHTVYPHHSYKLKYRQRDACYILYTSITRSIKQSVEDIIRQVVARWFLTTDQDIYPGGVSSVRGSRIRSRLVFHRVCRSVESNFSTIRSMTVITIFPGSASDIYHRLYHSCGQLPVNRGSASYITDRIGRKSPMQATSYPRLSTQESTSKMSFAISMHKTNDILPYKKRQNTPITTATRPSFPATDTLRKTTLTPAVTNLIKTHCRLNKSTPLWTTCG